MGMKTKRKSKLYRYISDSSYRFLVNSNLGAYKHMADAEYLKRKYKSVFGKELDLNDPKMYNEKLQWLKLYDRKDIYTVMVDKYLAKEYAGSIIGEKYIIPTYGVWNSIEEIDFESLPNQFVLKCTHDSGGVLICQDKKYLNVKATKRKINRCLKKNYYWLDREWPYKNVFPRILAEKFLEDSSVLTIIKCIHLMEKQNSS